ncbi:MAG: winged helix DNA-binding protein [Betaproteobacteria bacterium]|nr:winged helix DNA-binding protein [Betaproteobacteria bacterium]MCC6850997.1 winged helix DNA-binding protein [Rubrivivax sp.]MCL4697539.1 winged helix DNA-binding protein [Burkholderiaceae bacterium]
MIVRAKKTAAAPSAAAPAAPQGAARANAGGIDSALYSSPEFLFRRAHQIAAAAFTEACGHLDLTPSQYSALFMLREVNEVSQNELARLIALDRSTMSIVLRSLRDRRLTRELADPQDRRKKRLRLTDAGRLLLAEAEQLSADSSHRLLAGLGGEKAATLLTLLEELSAAPPVDGAG